MSSKLKKGAENAVKSCMGVKKGENVLIVTDPGIDPEIPMSVLEAAKGTTKNVEMVCMPTLSRNGEEPPVEIALMMKRYDVLFLITTKSLSHTSARRNASEAGVRVASMPGIDVFSLEKGGLTADYKEVRDLCKRMHKAVHKAKKIRVTNKKGTDIEMRFGNHEWDIDDGFFQNRGMFGNLPAGEVDTAPNEGSANGVLVFDEMDEWGKGIKLNVENGYVVEIEGSKKLEEVVEKLGKDARNIAELGIGTNPKAKLIGNVLEDEKVYETVHVAIGNNMSYGGSCDVPLHSDGIITKPTVEVDGRVVIRDGKWLV
jgi:leucyl aminopeptidase (aminopeptidase T)